MIYYVSDLHLGHANIIKLCNRPFSSVDEMDEFLINAWNKKVTNQDTVYIIGDLLWKSADINKYLPRLKGKKILITGNHDRNQVDKEEYKKYFKLITPYLETKVDNLTVTMCHYPLVEWRDSRKVGSKKLGYLIHGHIHNNYRPEYRCLFVCPNALNAGADVNGFCPVTIDELIANNEKFKLETLPTMLDKAEFLARKYHLYQFDKAGVAYIEHCKAVAAKLDGEDLKTIAYSHDLLEDTDISEALLEKTFPKRIVDAIKTMTKPPEQDYFDYIENVSKNPLAKQVKIADLTHNSDLSRLKTITEDDLKRFEKYKKALALLTTK